MSESAPMSAEPLYGTWTLVEFAHLLEGEVRGHPMGADALGQITYQRSGRMSALLMVRERPWPAGARFFESDDATIGAVARGFLGYGGPFDFDGERVFHHVELASFPEYVGTDLIRTVSWSGPHLVLETEHELTRSGRAMWDRLEWRRVDGA